MASAGAVNLPGLDWRAVAVILGGVAVAVWYLESRAGKIAGAVADAAPEIVEAVNPTNEDNVFNRGAVALWQSLTGSAETPGEDLFDLFHYGTIFHDGG